MEYREMLDRLENIGFCKEDITFFEDYAGDVFWYFEKYIINQCSLQNLHTLLSIGFAPKVVLQMLCRHSLTFILSHEVFCSRLEQIFQALGANTVKIIEQNFQTNPRIDLLSAMAADDNAVMNALRLLQ